MSKKVTGEAHSCIIGPVISAQTEKAPCSPPAAPAAPATDGSHPHRHPSPPLLVRPVKRSGESSRRRHFHGHRISLRLPAPSSVGLLPRPRPPCAGRHPAAPSTSPRCPLSSPLATGPSPSPTPAPGVSPLVVPPRPSIAFSSRMLVDHHSPVVRPWCMDPSRRPGSGWSTLREPEPRSIPPG